MAHNFNLTWQTVATQAAVYMVPLVLAAMQVQRIVTFAVNSQTDFEFLETRTKSREQGFDLFSDKESLSLVINEVAGKGLFPYQYQIALCNFAILWYFLSSFMVSCFALLYYRKFRDN